MVLPIFKGRHDVEIVQTRKLVEHFGAEFLKRNFVRNKVHQRLAARQLDARMGKFAGALQGKRANKGVFITTSNFSREAVEFVSAISTKIILIDGALLARFMVDHNVGVTPVGTYEVKKVDSDYFEGE